MTKINFALPTHVRVLLAHVCTYDYICKYYTVTLVVQEMVASG
jgi:hypothetical protein